MSSGFPRQRKYGDHVAVANKGKMARGLPWIVFPTLPARNNEKSKTNKPPKAAHPIGSHHHSAGFRSAQGPGLLFLLPCCAGGQSCCCCCFPFCCTPFAPVQLGSAGLPSAGLDSFGQVGVAPSCSFPHGSMCTRVVGSSLRSIHVFTAFLSAPRPVAPAWSCESMANTLVLFYTILHH